MTYAGIEQTGAGRLASGSGAARAARRVGIVLSEGFSLLAAGIVAEVFQLANESGAAAHGECVRYSVRLLSLQGGGIRCSSSVQVWTDELDVRAQNAFDALFISGSGADPSSDPRLPGTPARAPQRKSAHAADLDLNDTRDAASMAAGASRATLVFDLPAAQADDRYEAVKSALTLVVRDHGLDIAREIAERLMPGSSAKLMPLLGSVGTTVGEKVRRSAQWLRENCDRPISVADAAQEAAMSERNFLRRFKLEIGSTPSEYLLQARLDMTCRLLAGTELPVDKIARRSGMGNGDHLAKIFRKRWSISPTEYRLRNRRERDALAAIVAPAAAAELETRDFAF
ncbi:GlxA family transcriptional regulator [Paraburkholderia solisilvae]|uniref:HTH-type transcriptional activator RhaS n=1 Tax=Paraburkholderia solisilvae TaxID=624376 RepID=A0A6J5DVJ2_9BURK|nr:helix-turn-helix domain-containing protein [Paraburkholderia solisilvae]CAB3758260.1 HTH-type transcriptional activator RhaS [Paraburkholderia solisilvae]